MTRAAGLAIATAVLALPAVAALAQSSAPPVPAPSTQKQAAERPSVRLSPGERRAIEAAESDRVKPASIEDSLAPTADDIKPHSPDDPSRTRIEQTHVSNRVSEVIVTPAGQSRSYVMHNREGRQPFGATQMNSGLSVPMFFRFEFGRSTPPATNPPPPPAPSPSR